MVRTNEDVENMEFEIEAVTFGRKSDRKKLVVNVSKSDEEVVDGCRFTVTPF